ncbi:TM0106 family RecB-like putative nuclease [candidate division WWE3 bacterium]|uniref:TM0106 family RecB-like putative nuclease n=1 Tax=candidate division WWE3 bacterium TaxID=2053526 RepID=A0A928TRG2_UNCKA|nr:TM0106 family RecB-like putative nuclease [candidate division WWE3 bacterium]
MKRRKDYLTATDFYKFLTCPHWPWFDRFASEGEAALKREQTPGEIRRWDDGVAHEKRVMEQVFGGRGVTELSSTGNPETLFRETTHAMESGAEIIYQGTLISGDWQGRPDILIKTDGSSSLGNWHYIPVDIKAAHVLKPSHRYQLMFYSILLERIQGVFPEKAGIINNDQEEHWFDPRTDFTDFENILGRLESIRQGDKPDLVLRKACFDTSPWGRACEAQAKAANDIALLYNVDVKKLSALRLLGIRTVDDAAEMHIESLAGAAPGLTAHALESIKFQAQSLIRGTVFIKEPVEFSATPFEIHFDIESDPPNDVDYLYGILIRHEGKEEYRSFLARKPEDEKEMWTSFLAWLETLPSEFIVYHYAPYEPMRLAILEERYGGSIWLDRFRSRFIDLKPYATKRVTYPLYFYGLKYICTFLGFHWRGNIKSGGESIDWFERWCEKGDEEDLRQILEYNEDDVRATAFLRDWLTQYASELAAYDPPYPWEGSRK